MNISAIAAWLATYAIHSTILLGAALLASRFIVSHRAREMMWKLAIVGGLFTSIFASLADITPVAGRWTVGSQHVESVSPREATPAIGTSIGAPAESPTRSAAGRTESGDPVAGPPRAYDWAAVIVAIWGIVSLLMIARLVLQHRRLFGALRSRTPVNEGPLPGMLAELRRKAAIWIPVRLSASSACPTPIALRSSEICIPARFATDLDVEQQRSALAHELAHLKRRDPVWQLAIGITESIFFFQPLNVVGRKRLRDAAEFLCDDWAVEQTNSPLALAKCLTQISSWVGSAPVPDGMLAMAEGGSPLITRIHRLANWQPSRLGSLRMVTAAAVALVALVATSAPVLSAPSVETAVIASITPSREISSPNAAPDSLIRYAGPPASLEQRWAWALAQHSPAPFWIGWEVEAPAVQARSLTSGSTGAPHPSRSAQSLADFIGGRSPSHAAGILIRVDAGGGVTGVRLQSLSEPAYFGSRHVVWLSQASSSESVARLQRLLASAEETEIRSELAAGLALHADPAVAVRALATVIGAEANAEVRVEAVQWMARLHGTDAGAVALLRELALRDRQLPVRMEAVDGLRTAMHNGSREARVALVAIADSDADMSVRSEAMQALSRR